MADSEHLITFEPDGDNARSEGKIDGILVAVITKNINHKHNDSNMYSVDVLDERIGSNFREIKDARKAANLALIKKVPLLLSDDTIRSTMDAVGPRPFHTGHFIDSLRTTRPGLWIALVARYGEGGHGAGRYYSAFSAVAQALHRAAGRGVLEKIKEYVPAPPELNWGNQVIRYWNGPAGTSDHIFPDVIIENSEDKSYDEGNAVKVLVNRYERSQEARAACIRHYGVVCQGCNINFLVRYGERGRDFIHVHHLRPLSGVGKDYKINPITDLRPVCPNCHAMIHRREPMLSIEELRSIIDLSS